jgi:hypothetical protein
MEGGCMSNPVILTTLPGGRHSLAKPIHVVVTHVGPRTYTANAPELGLWCPGLGETKEEALADLAEALTSIADRFSQIDLTDASRYANNMRAVLQKHVS